VNGGPTSGKAIFDQRVEYPLPKRQGIRDYLIYLVPADNDYGKAARKFLGKFYRGHRTGSARSLEEMIGFLRTDLASGGITQVRELVIVCHGAPQGLILPIVRDASSPGDEELENVTALGLVHLQKDFETGRPDFKANRAFVAQRLKDDSWITFRACQVGQGADVLYALFSFFGGRANVYAPSEYMFFGDHPIEAGTRVGSKMEVHDHLVKQRLFPSDVHTPERKNAIVAAVIDPGRFSEPFELVSSRIGDTTSDAAVRYQRSVTALNRRRIHDDLRARFAAAGHELSKHAWVRVSVRNVAWIVGDPVRHAGLAALVRYDVGEEVETSGTNQIATLSASATIVDRDDEDEDDEGEDDEGARDDERKHRGAPAYRPTFPAQLFFRKPDNNQYKGLIERLAVYVDPGGNPAEAVLNALRGVLPAEGASPVAIPAALATALSDKAGLTLTDQARLVFAAKRAKSRGPEEIDWAIDDGEKYLIRLEHPPSGAVRAHMLSLYHDLRGKDGAEERVRMTGYLGLVPDTPGTELAAYLDRRTIEELVGLIDHLRAPYRPEHSFYIHHAQEAIRRKKEWSAWSSGRSAGNQDPLAFLVDPYDALTGAEAEDKRRVAHEFPFNSVWREVKVSHPKLGIPQNDLFAEEPLKQKLRIADGAVSAELELDSPASNIDELRKLEGPAPDGFTLVEKDEFEFADEPGPDCMEFRTILEHWKSLDGLDDEEIRRRLDLETASDGKTFLDHVSDLKFAFRIGKKLTNIVFERTPKGFVERIVARIPGLGIPSALGVPTTFVALLRILPAFTIAFDLWMRSAEDEERADQVAETTGKVVAVRQWLRELIAETRTPDFPEGVDIDLRRGLANPPMDRYLQEQADDDRMAEPRSFVIDLDRLEKGFDEGIRMMEKATDEMLERADDAIDDVFGELDIDPCKAKVLADVGVLDMRELRASVVRELCFRLLRQIPKA
jgi:hypothetical protein